MVGSVGGGGGDRSKEAVGMMALHEALRSVCLNSDWTYSVFWTIRPRPRVRGGNGCKVGDDNGSLMLMWEDGYCRGRDCMDEIDNSEDAVRKAFSKMSIQLYNYGEGLMGKVASDKCHKWVFKEPSECEPNISNYWQSSFDALPPEWTDQFESGIQTIAVIQAGHGLLQLGSCKIIPEDLHFVLRMRHTFESLGYQSGFYLSQLFSSTRNASSSASLPTKQHPIPPQLRPPPLFNWGSQRPLPSPTSIPPPNFHRPVLAFPPTKDETHMFLQMPHSVAAAENNNNNNRLVEDQMTGGGGDESADIKWPNGLSIFNALTGRAEDARLLFNPENFGHKVDQNNNHHHGHGHHVMMEESKNGNHQDGCHDQNMHQQQGGGNMNEFLSLDSNHQDGVRKMQENKFKRSFTLPARMTSSSSSTSLDHHHHHSQQQHPSEGAAAGGMYSDVMETFLE